MDQATAFFHVFCGKTLSHNSRVIKSTVCSPTVRKLMTYMCYELPAIPYLPQDKQKMEKVSHNPSTYYHGFFFFNRMFVGNVSGKEKVRLGIILQTERD